MQLIQRDTDTKAKFILDDNGGPCTLCVISITLVCQGIISFSMDQGVFLPCGPGKTVLSCTVGLSLTL